MSSCELDMRVVMAGVGTSGGLARKGCISGAVGGKVVAGGCTIWEVGERTGSIGGCVRGIDGRVAGAGDCMGGECIGVATPSGACVFGCGEVGGRGAANGGCIIGSEGCMVCNGRGEALCNVCGGDGE